MALARALVTRPAILLLDEPLGALDEKLRLDMQVELLELHRQLGMTFVYITHSQEEALTMSDRVVLMRRGRIVQEGPPRELFERPINRFVADFMGVENILEGSLRALEGERATVQVRNRVIHGLWCGRRQGSPGNPVAVGVRAERIFLGNPKAEAGRTNQLPGRPETTIYKGKYLDQSVETEVGTIKARIWDSHVDVARNLEPVVGRERLHDHAAGGPNRRGHLVDFAGQIQREAKHERASTAKRALTRREVLQGAAAASLVAATSAYPGGRQAALAASPIVRGYGVTTSQLKDWSIMEKANGIHDGVHRDQCRHRRLHARRDLERPRRDPRHLHLRRRHRGRAGGRRATTPR